MATSGNVILLKLSYPRWVWLLSIIDVADLVSDFLIDQDMSKGGS